MKEKTPEVSPTAKEDCCKRKNNQILTCPASVTMTLGRTVKMTNLNFTPELAQCLTASTACPYSKGHPHTNTAWCRGQKEMAVSQGLKTTRKM